MRPEVGKPSLHALNHRSNPGTDGIPEIAKPLRNRTPVLDDGNDSSNGRRYRRNHGYDRQEGDIQCPNGYRQGRNHRSQRRESCQKCAKDNDKVLHRPRQLRKPSAHRLDHTDQRRQDRIGDLRQLFPQRDKGLLQFPGIGFHLLHGRGRGIKQPLCGTLYTIVSTSHRGQGSDEFQVPVLGHGTKCQSRKI